MASYNATSLSTKAPESVSDQGASRTRDYFSRLYMGVKTHFTQDLRQEELDALRKELVSTKAELDITSFEIESLTRELEERDTEAESAVKGLKKRCGRLQKMNERMKEESDDARRRHQQEVYELQADVEELQEERFQAKTSLRKMGLMCSNTKAENMALKGQIANLTLSLSASSDKEKMLKEKLRLQAVCQTDLEVKFGLVRSYKSQVHTLETELRSMRSNFDDAKWKQKSLESEIFSKDILIDSLWEEVYNPSEKSMVVRQLKQVKQEKEDLSASLNASNAIIEELNYRLALRTPIPADDDDESELDLVGVIDELSEKVEDLEEQLSLALGEAIVAESELLELGERCGDLEIQNEVSAKELAAKNEILHAVTIKLDHQCKLNEALVRENKDLLKRIKSLEESNSVMSWNIELQDDYCTQIESDRVALLSQVEVYEERVSSFTEKVAILEKTIEENLEMARGNEVRNGEEIMRGRVQLSTLERKLSRAEARNASLEQDISSLEESLSSRNKELEEATSEVSKLEAMVKSLSRDIDSKDLEIAALRSSRRDADDKKIKATEQPTLPVNMSPTASTMEARQQVASNGPSTSMHHDTVGAQQQPRTFTIPTHHSERSHSYRTPSSQQARAKASDGGDYVVLGQNGESAFYPHRTPYHGVRSSGGYNGHPWNSGRSFYRD